MRGRAHHGDPVDERKVTEAQPFVFDSILEAENGAAEVGVVAEGIECRSGVLTLYPEQQDVVVIEVNASGIINNGNIVLHRSIGCFKDQSVISNRLKVRTARYQHHLVAVMMKMTSYNPANGPGPVNNESHQANNALSRKAPKPGERPSIDLSRAFTWVTSDPWRLSRAPSALNIPLFIGSLRQDFRPSVWKKLV
jgi:hypothetical protein